MKKISLLALILATSAVVFAQSPKFGLKAGVNLSNLVNNNSQYSDLRKYRTGFNAGLLAHIHTNNKSIAIQPEVMFSSQGSTLKLSPDQDVILNYINVPILLQYMFDNGFRLETGPQVGALISAKAKDDVGSQSIKDEFKSGDFSWAFGLGYLTYSGLGIDARYNLGISNINNLPAPNNGKLRNSVFQVGLFYMLDNSHKAKSR